MLSQKVWQRLSSYNSLSQLVAACGIGLMLGAAALWFSPLWTLGALAVGGLILATLKRPEIALLAILILTSSIVYEEALPVISTGIGRFHISDVILLALFGLIGLRRLVEPRFRIVRTPFDCPLLAFYAVAVLSTLIAVLRSSVTIRDALSGVRLVTYYLTFFIVTNLVREERQLNLLLRGLFLLATIVAAAMIVQFLVGESLPLLPGRVENLSTWGESYSDITRILPPGQSLILVSFFAITCILVLDKFTPINMFRFLQWAMLGLALVLTFVRAYWVGMILGLLLLAYLVKGQDRQRLVQWGLVVMFLVLVVLGPLVVDPESRAARLVSASIERLGTLVQRKTLSSQESTLRWRYSEYEYALAQITSHPFIGLGLGVRYRPWDPSLDWKGPDDSGFDGRAYIHNGHLWILMKSGLLGYLCFVWLSLAFLFRGFRYWRRIPNSQMKGSVLGSTLAYLAVLVGSVTSPLVMEWHWTPVIGLMMGLNEVRLGSAASSPEQRVADILTPKDGQHER